MKNTEISLHIPPLIWQQIRRAMLDARREHEETIAFLFCQKDRAFKHQIRYLTKAWVVPAPDCYELQSNSGLVIKQEFHQYLLDRFLKNYRYDVVHIHTHTGTGFPEFSAVDDRAESEYARFLSRQFRSKPRLISGVFDESLQHGQFRIWNRKGMVFESITCYNSFLSLPPLAKAASYSSFERPLNGIEMLYQSPLVSASLVSAPLVSASLNQRGVENSSSGVERSSSGVERSSSGVERSSSGVERSSRGVERSSSGVERSSSGVERSSSGVEMNDMFSRQTIFGETAQQQLGQLTVALIGCGGIGSIFAETLGRLGVKKWILVDPDRVETVNLNRMPAATAEMVAGGWHKVHYIKHLLKQIYPHGASVRAIPDSIESSPDAIATADLIVVATDNHSSRQIAQEIALKYLRPLVCLGTHIDVKPDGTPRMYARVTVPPLGGGWCLMCGNIINLHRAALESSPGAIHHMAGRAGYLEGVNDPAVFWLNSICASTAVGVIHGLVSGFVNVDAGIDWIYEFPSQEWRKTNTEYFQTNDCYFCSHPH